MIEKVSSFKTTAGDIHSSLEEARKHELGAMLDGKGVQSCMATAEVIIANREAIIAILGTKARKPRTPKADRPAAVKPAKLKP